MPRYFLILIAMCFAGCRTHPENPDISGISIELQTFRYEKDLFALDTNQFAEGLNTLAKRYPGFQEDFLFRIMNAEPNWDDNLIADYIRSFAVAYRPLYDSAEKVFSDFSPYEQEMADVMKRCKYYFPGYKLPGKIITYIGPLDGYGDILSDNAVLVGLHHHLGKENSAYLSSWLGQTYPKYITDRFEPSNISVNLAGNLINDLFPENSGAGPEASATSLIAQMIESGKRLYLKSLLLPEKEEHWLIGYSRSQLKDCYTHEKVIWNLFLKNNLLQTTDKVLIRNYLGDSPKTQELGESAPGNIGSFAGWQIVKKFMSKNPEMKPDDLMKTDAEKIFETTKYKP